MLKKLVILVRPALLLFCLTFLACGGGTGSYGSSESAATPSSGTSTVGKGGSTARFKIVNNYMYVLSGEKMKIFNIEDQGNLKPWATISVGFDIETLFSYNEKLFIGSSTGMYIYDNSDPANPQKLSSISHATSCDPVVVSGDIAFVTLRSDDRCRRGNNKLEIIDVSDPSYPIKVKEYAMTQPFGLGVDGDKLFICDGQAGLKVYDSKDPLKLSLIEQLDQEKCFDVIPGNNILITTGASRVSQYNYQGSLLEHLSTIDS